MNGNERKKGKFLLRRRVNSSRTSCLNSLLLHFEAPIPLHYCTVYRWIWLGATVRFSLGLYMYCLLRLTLDTRAGALIFLVLVKERIALLTKKKLAVKLITVQVPYLSNCIRTWKYRKILENIELTESLAIYSAWPRHLARLANATSKCLCYHQLQKRSNIWANENW